MGRLGSGRLCGMLVGGLIGVLMLPASAPAVTVLVGPPDLTTAAQKAVIGPCLRPECSRSLFFNTALPEIGSLVTAPADGTITSWRLNADPDTAGSFRLHVLRPLGGGQFAGVGASPAADGAVDGVVVNATNLPVQAGDSIGIDVIAGAGPNGIGPSMAFRNLPGAAATGWYPAAPLEAVPSTPNFPYSDKELLYNSTVDLLAPVITGVSPGSGSTTGGNAVTITGQHLAVAAAVKFGSAPAASIQSASDTEIVATAPPQSLGTVDVTVTTAGGSNDPSAVDQYAYTDGTPPETGIDRGPHHKTTHHRVKFTFSSTEPGSTFVCKLDKSVFKPCTSPHKVRVAFGKHLFQVEAVDPSGNTDATPVSFRWRVVRP